VLGVGLYSVTFRLLPLLQTALNVLAQVGFQFALGIFDAAVAEPAILGDDF